MWITNEGKREEKGGGVKTLTSHFLYFFFSLPLQIALILGRRRYQANRSGMSY